jgi:hypothetical protein
VGVYYMTLADKLNGLERSKTGLPCGISTLKTKMSEEDFSALEAVLSVKFKPGGIGNRKIQDLLTQEGYDVAYASITLHRRRECRCFTGRDKRLSIINSLNSAGKSE